MKKGRILLADSQMLIMEAVTKLLEPEFDVIARVADGRELLKTAIQLKPDLVILDVSMTLINGLEAGRLLKLNVPGVKLIYLTTDQDAIMIDRAFRLGAAAFLLKSCTASELLDSIRGALLRDSYRSPFVTRSHATLGIAMRGETRRKDPLRLTRRQREVLQLLAAGRSMKEVAFVLHIKPRTVAYHKYRMMDDLNLSSNAALVRFAVRERVA